MESAALAIEPIAIEPNIPLPPTTAGRSAIYPFASMQPGDSFEVAKTAAQLSSTLGHWRRKLGHRYTIRTIEPGRVRVWRVA